MVESKKRGQRYMLNYQKGAPALYLQIRDILRKEILLKKYPLGSYIPTETEFEHIFSVSKITIRKAIQYLEDEGYLQKQKGRGTIVIQNHYFNKLSKTKSYSEKLEQLGVQLMKANIESESLELTKGDEAYGKIADRVQCISRVILADKKILSYMRTYLPQSLGVEIDIDKPKWSLYGELSSQGIVVDHSEDFFTAILATSYIAGKLSVTDGTPILKRIRIGYDHLMQVIEYSIGFYLTESIPYIIEMGK